MCVFSPLLFEGVLQHLDPSHQVLLQVLLTPSLPLQEGDLGLEENGGKADLNFLLCIFDSAVIKIRSPLCFLLRANVQLIA